ncbi:Angiotensin-converting enzyme [Folsomia candida]|uniref:Angiotensin-converting enzyme n=1 Tax=Folsomia candida TaxID=158441 RepID=A0A226E4B2_FOLCA|nr:Angiotensin-converting enzyme [Folsomia candida]
MANWTVMNLLLFALVAIPLCTKIACLEEALAKNFLLKLETEVRPVCHQRALSEWNFHTNLTDSNRKKSLESSIEYSKFWRRMWEEASHFDWRSFKDPDTRRQFSMMTTLGVAILPDDLLKRVGADHYNMLKQNMESEYGKATVCDFYNQSKCDLALEPDITEIFLTSRNPAELKFIWLQWRNVTGAAFKQNYTDFISLMQTVAQMNNFSSPTEYELRSYETEELTIRDFREQIDSLWSTLSPFYKELHAYVRFKLRNFYGDEVFQERNMWAETWESIEDIVLPFTNKQSFNITQRMQELKMTPIDMAKLGETFFVSLGLPKLNELFWKNSIFEKPPDSDLKMICHPSAWDLCDQQDFRDSCLDENYNLNRSFVFGKDGANPGFHEAIGDLIALSVQTMTHMESIGLIQHFEYDKETEINYLLRIALTKIAFLPYGYILDKWKWEVAYAKSPDMKKSLNCKWWELREEFQGVGKPHNINYGEEFLDPASKYHVISNVPYVRYFISMILQFQLHESLCKEAKNTKPLHLCDIYNSKRAGLKLKKLLSLGASKPWPVVLATVTDTQKLSSKSILKYFEPLYKWLKEENVRNNQTPGWRTTTTCNDRPLTKIKSSKGYFRAKITCPLDYIGSGVKFNLNLRSVIPYCPIEALPSTFVKEGC